MTANSIWIDWLILICQVHELTPNRHNLAFYREFIFYCLCSIYSPLFYFQLFSFFSSITYLPSPSSSSTSSSWIIHWVIHNLGEAARDLHSSLCHWVLFGGIFNNCLIYQIDWELRTRALRAAMPDMSNYGRGECQILSYSRLHMTVIGTSYSPSTPIILHFRTGWNASRSTSLHEVYTNEVPSQFIVSHCVRDSALTSYYVCFRLALLCGVCLP